MINGSSSSISTPLKILITKKASIRYPHNTVCIPGNCEKLQGTINGFGQYLSHRIPRYVQGLKSIQLKPRWFFLTYSMKNQLIDLFDPRTTTQRMCRTIIYIYTLYIIIYIYHLPEFYQFAIEPGAYIYICMYDLPTKDISRC